MNKKILMLLVLLLIPKLCLAQNLNILVINLDVFKNDTVIEKEIKLTFGSPLMLPSTPGNYSLRVLNKERAELYRRDFELSFIIFSDPPVLADHSIVYDKISFNSSMHFVRLYHSGRIIFEKSLADVLCNNNSKCEPEAGESFDLCPSECHCGNGKCELNFQENYGSCSKDCPSGSADNYCDKLLDRKCDPDCTKEEDEDCVKPQITLYIYVVVFVVLAIIVIVFLLKTKMVRYEGTD